MSRSRKSTNRMWLMVSKSTTMLTATAATRTNDVYSEDNDSDDNDHKYKRYN